MILQSLKQDTLLQTSVKTEAKLLLNTHFFKSFQLWNPLSTDEYKTVEENVTIWTKKAQRRRQASESSSESSLTNLSTR